MSTRVMVEAPPVRFVAPDGTHWSVHEVSGPQHGERSLIFVCDAGFRRVRSYPDGWRELAPDALWRLSWSR